MADEIRMMMRETTHFQQQPLPNHLLIETTTRCNLRCKQCARLIDKYALADMDMETFYRLKPLFPSLTQVALYGHGETFLHTQFFTMLEDLKKHDIFVYVTSNGMLLTEDVAERIVALKLDRLSFSLDAATPKLFNEIRRGADFEKIVRNIRRLNDFKKQAHRDDAPMLSIMFCAMKSTIQELPKLVRLADELNMLHGIAVLNITEYDQMEGEGLTRYPELAKPYLHEANVLATKLAIPIDLSGAFDDYVQPVHINFWDRIYRNYREFRRSFDRKSLFKTKCSRVLNRLSQPGHILSSSSDMQDVSAPVQINPSSHTIRVRDCRDPWEFMFVNVHGDVRVCCVSHRIMGNIYDADVTTIWNNQRYQEFRNRFLSPDPPEECQTCPMRGWHNIPIP